MKREAFAVLLINSMNSLCSKPAINGVNMWFILKFQWPLKDAHVTYVCLFCVACQSKDKQWTLVYIKREIVEDGNSAQISVYCECLGTKFSYFDDRNNWVYLEWVMDFITGVILRFLCTYLCTYVCIYRFQNFLLPCPTPRLHCFLSSYWPSFRFLSFMAFFIPSI
jgi:hypothetical protein